MLSRWSYTQIVFSPPAAPPPPPPPPPPHTHHGNKEPVFSEDIAHEGMVSGMKILKYFQRI